MVKILLFFITFLTMHSLPALSQTQGTKSSDSSEQSPRFAIHLLDYLAHDYGGSVENGKVISPSEYAEQKEFLEDKNNNKHISRLPFRISNSNFENLNISH